MRATSSQHLKIQTLLELVALVTSLIDKDCIVHCEMLGALTFERVGTSSDETKPVKSMNDEIWAWRTCY